MRLIRSLAAAALIMSCLSVLLVDDLGRAAASFYCLGLSACLSLLALAWPKDRR